LKAAENNDTDGESNLEDCLEDIESYLIERGTFSTSHRKFSISLNNIPPLIPSYQRKMEINSESQKKSIYLKNNDKLEGMYLFIQHSLSFIIVQH